MEISKFVAFLLTFLCYTSVHCLRTAYSSAKGGILKDLNLKDDRLMGIPDALMLFFLGVGHFMHSMKPLKYPIKSLWMAMIVCGINYALLPIMMDVEYLNNFVILCVLMSINGFMQSYTWPTLLMTISRYLKKEKNGALLGFWTTNANFGNIIGYLIFLILTRLETQGNSVWQTGLLFSALYAMANGVACGGTIPEVKIDEIDDDANGGISN